MLSRSYILKSLGASSRSFSVSRAFLNNSKSPPSKDSINGIPDAKKPATGGSFLNTVALLFAGALVGTAYASYNLYTEPPEFVFPKTSTLPLASCVPVTYGDSRPLIEELKLVLRDDQISESNSEMESHSDSYFSTDHPSQDERPDAVIFPESTEEVSKVLKLAHKYHVPVTPYTGGTSLEGHYIPTRRGITVDLSHMDKILALHETDLDIVVQPAVGWEDLREYLAPHGLLFGPDPGPGACIGGMIGTSCSGTNAARYGTMRENVVSITVVLADGTIIKTRKRPRKSSCGYNLNNLFIGSEGTLGIVTEATLKLNAKPKFEHVAIASFPEFKDAASAVQSIVRSGIPVNAMELLDANMMKFVNQSGETTQKYAEMPTMMLKIGGNSTAVADAITADVKKICSDAGCGKTFRFATSDDEKEELWGARKVALWSTIDAGKAALGPDCQIWTTDVAVPISRLVESLELTQQEFDKENLMTSIVSHAGDGNYHALICYLKKDHDKVSQVVKNMVSRALAMDGTATGEHGVGIGKREFLLEELGQDSVDLMRKLKFALDPLRILNPDKILQIDPKEPRGGH